jgi:hypothetical protein
MTLSYSRSSSMVLLSRPSHCRWTNWKRMKSVASAGPFVFGLGLSPAWCTSKKRGKMP